MEVQLFDSGGDFCMRVNAGEPLWKVLRDGLRETGIVTAGDPLERDASIGGVELATLLDNIHAALRERVARILPTDAAGHYDEGTIMVDGEPIFIRVRDPRYQDVKRINSLHRCLARIVESNRRAQLLAVPDLNTIDHGIAAVLEGAPSGLDVSQLGALLSQRFTQLQSVTEERAVRESLSRHADSVDDSTITEHLEKLAHWGLVDYAPDGTAFASKKLHRILR